MTEVLLQVIGSVLETARPEQYVTSRIVFIPTTDAKVKQSVDDDDCDNEQGCVENSDSVNSVDEHTSAGIVFSYAVMFLAGKDVIS